MISPRWGWHYLPLYSIISPRWGLLYIFNYFIYYDTAPMGLAILPSFSNLISPR